MVPKKVVKNYIYNLMYQVLIVMAPLITTPYVSRVLQSNGIGDYSYTHTIAQAFALFAALGVNQYGQREIAYRQDNKYERSKVFYELFVLRLITTIIVSLFYIAFALWYNTYTVYLFAQAFVVVATMLDISWFFQGIENFKIIAIRNLFVKVATIILIFIFVQKESDVLQYILINSFSILFGCLLCFLNLKNSIDRIPLSELNIVRHLKGTIEFFIPLIATQLYSHLDKIMLGAMVLQSSENGYYEQSRKIVAVIVSVLTSINTVMYPRVSNLYVNEENLKIKEYYETTFSIIIMLLCPMTAGLFVVSDNLVIWFLGEDFLKAVPLLKLSSVLLVFMSVGNFVGIQYLSPTGQQNKMTFIYLISAFLNIVLNFIMIPQLLSIGAMLASIVAEAFSAFAQVLLIKKSEYNFKMLSGLKKYVFASLIMGCLIFAFSNSIALEGLFLTVLQFFIGVIVYVIMLTLLKEKNVTQFWTKVVLKKK